MNLRIIMPSGRSQNYPPTKVHTIRFPLYKTLENANQSIVTESRSVIACGSVDLKRGTRKLDILYQDNHGGFVTAYICQNLTAFKYLQFICQLYFKKLLKGFEEKLKFDFTSSDVFAWNQSYSP